MNKALPVALFVWGIVLIVFGAKAAQFFGSDASRLFAGSPKDNAIWMLVAGIISVSIGLFGALQRSKYAGAVPDKRTRPDASCSDGH